MKIGDRVRIVTPDFTNHEFGDEGVIYNIFWKDDDVDCFGVKLDYRPDPYANDPTGPDEGWAYLSTEIEVIQ